MQEQSQVRENRLPTPPNADTSSTASLMMSSDLLQHTENTHPSNNKEDRPSENHIVYQEKVKCEEASPPSPHTIPEDETNSSTGKDSSGSAQEIAAATAEAIASAKAATGNAMKPELQFLEQFHGMRAEDAAVLQGSANGGDAPRVSLALLLEATAAAAEAERNATGNQDVDSDTLRRCAQERAETDKYITEAIHRVQTTPRTERNVELRPLDRRELEITGEWSRYDHIQNDPQLLGECRRLVRGTQGCGRECDAKFTNLVDFAKHVDKMHDINFRPFLCPKDHCPWAVIGFHERSECTRHIRTKHYKAMYSCEFQGCTKVYNRSDAFRRHVRQAHANPGSRFNRLTQRSDNPK